MNEMAAIIHGPVLDCLGMGVDIALNNYNSVKMNRLASSLIHYTNRYGSHRLLQQHAIKRNILYHQTTIFQQQHKRSITTTITHKHTHQTTLNNIHPQHLYQIINNVDQYYSFLPYCNESKILQTSNCGTMYDAVLKVGFSLPSSSSLLPGSSSSLLEERYVSRVKMTPPSTKDSDMKPIWIVEAKSIQSQLFDSLKSRWQLSIADDTNQISNIVQQQYTNNVNSQYDTNNVQSTAASCNVNFEVEIQVSNPLISFTLSQVLKDVAKKQVDAFEKRCIDVPTKMV